MIEPQSSIAIVGAGPAGVSTAVQLKRFGFSPLIFEKNTVGGLLHNAFFIENYPGFPGGVSGTEMCARLQRHLDQYDIEVINEEVTGCDYQAKECAFVVKTAKSCYRADFLVVASGTVAKVPRWYPSIPSHLKQSVFFEIGPIANERNRKVLIVGSGDAALDYSLSLARKNRVTIVSRSVRFRGLSILQERVDHHNMIQSLRGYRVCGLGGNTDSLRVVIESKQGSVADNWDYLICAIGRRPQRDFFSGALRRSRADLISDGRLYTVGDVQNGRCRQMGIAVGNGILAAMKIYYKVMEKA
jgi:thioredoxin reductase